MSAINSRPIASQRSGLVHVSKVVERLLAMYGIDVNEFVDAPEQRVATRARQDQVSAPFGLTSPASGLPLDAATQMTFPWFAFSELSV